MGYLGGNMRGSDFSNDGIIMVLLMMVVSRAYLFNTQSLLYHRRIYSERWL